MLSMQEDIKGQLAASIDNAYLDFIKILNSVKEEQLNTVPFEGSWTAGQVTDHILKATADIPDGNTRAADRPFHVLAPELESTFLNFDIKMQAPEFVQPGNGPFSKNALIESLDQTRNLHLETIANKDLTAVCLDFEFPYTGHLTRYEWFRFFAAHVRRHTRQLQHIAGALSKSVVFH
jgi:hypothetical protein